MIIYYSVLKLFAGFAIAAFIAWKLIVNNAIINERNPARTNIHQLIFIRYAKSRNQLCMTNHAIGEAITKAIITSLMKSLDNNKTILDTDAPNTFLMPISLVRCDVANNDNPNKPRHAMRIAKQAKTANTFQKRRSLLYCSLNFSSRK
jgi:hypothetical protein